MAETIFNAVIAETNSRTGSKQFQPSDGDSLLTWLLANIPSRGTLPFTFMKIGNAPMSDLPSFANSTTEFEGTVFGYADRLVVELNRYSTASYEKWVRTIYQNNWYGAWEQYVTKEPTKLSLTNQLSSISVVNNDAYRFGNIVVANIRFNTTATITSNSTLFSLPNPINSNAMTSNSAVVSAMLKEPSDGTSYNATVIADGSVYCTVNIPNGKTLLFYTCYVAK